MGIDHLSVIESSSARIVEILRQEPLDARVPGCPEWDLADLGVHMVGVQRWSAHIVRLGELGEDPEHVPPLRNEVADALQASSAELMEALRAADPEAPCWNFSDAPQVQAFWFRRQANEVVVHAWDAESAVSDTPPPIEREVAADVVDEFVTMSIPRVIAREGVDISGITGDVHIHCTDLQDHEVSGVHASGEWTFEIKDGTLVVVAEHRKSAVAIRGGASDLALYLYGRTSADTVEIFGDPESLAQWAPLLAF